MMLCLALVSTLASSGQNSVPDNVCAGQNREYWVDPNPVAGSAYTWLINGVVQQGFSSNRFSCKWDIPGAYILELNEVSAAGCVGGVRKLQVTVHPPLVKGYLIDVSEFNNYNVSCFGFSDGFIHLIDQTAEEGLNYQWTGPGNFRSELRDIDTLRAGIYTLKVTDANSCTVSDTVVLKEPGRLNIKTISSVSADGSYNLDCAGDRKAFIEVTPFNYVKSIRYLWSDGSEDAKRTSLAAGNYSVIATDGNNCNADTLVAIREPDSLKVTFINKLPVCYNDASGEIVLNATGGVRGNDYSYRWMDNSTSPVLTGLISDNYWVTVTDMNGCTVTDTVKLGMKNESCLEIPNSFSPNGDLINDYWEIGNISKFPDVEVKIFNNWGELVWNSVRGYGIPWDGRSNGQVLPVDSYYYVIDFKNGSRMLAGSVTIIK